jgi:small conductance mechanosensitive channel
MKKTKVDTTLHGFTKNLVYISLLVFVIIAAISRLGFQTTSFVAVIGAAGLAVGLALQGSLANFAAGVLLVIFKPFRVGDFIEISGVKGVVQEIAIFNTTINSPDNVRIIVANAQVTSGNIVNYTANGTRRVDLVIGVSYEDDLQKARQVMLDLIIADKRILQKPVPVIAVSQLADSSVNFVVRPWCNTDDYWDVYFDLTEKIKVALDHNGISIPFPQHDVHMKAEQNL